MTEVVGNTLEKSAANSPEKTAIVWRNVRLTYRELDQRANQLAHALLALRLGKSATVAILSSNRPEYGIAYFAIARTPYISAHCSTRSSASELAFVLSKTQAKVLFVESQFLPLVLEARGLVKQRFMLVILNPDPIASADLADSTYLGNFVEKFSTDKPEYLPKAEDGLAITFTGGTTGYPKAVLVSHAARYASSAVAAEEFGLTGTDVFLASTPLFHTVGLFVWFGTAIMLGASIVLLDQWSPADFMESVQRDSITAAFLVPSQLNALITDPSFSIVQLKSLRHISFAGAPMSEALFARVREAIPGIEFVENYGQSEVCPITVRREHHGPNKYGTVGKPVRHLEIGIVDRNLILLPPNQVGDIVVRADTVFTEYFEDAEETEKTFSMQEGWLLTGDVGSLDDDGFLSLVDRSKDMLISGGENVYPAEIENALYQHPAVQECAVIGIPDDYWGEIAAAFVVKAAGTEITAEQLIDFCAAKIARFKRPRLVRFVDTLPKTTIGKVRKNILREPFWTGRDKNI